MVETIILTKSPLKTKKYRAEFSDGKHIDFGASGYQDFILSGGNITKKNAYIARHKSSEDWTKKGLRTAGFFARWLLWEEPSLQKAISKAEDKFNVKIIHKL